MGVAEELQAAQGLLASGDVQGLLRYLRADGEALPLGEVARLVAGAARLAGFEDLAQAAAAGGDGAEDARRCTTSATRALSAGPATWRSGRWRVRSSWRRTPGRCSASSSRPSSRTGSTPAPWRCSRSTSR